MWFSGGMLLIGNLFFNVVCRCVYGLISSLVGVCVLMFLYVSGLLCWKRLCRLFIMKVGILILLLFFSGECVV